MSALEWILQIAVVGLLAAALPFVLRLERELRTLRRDRAAFDGSAAGLSEATRMAESASLRLRASAESAGRQLAEKLAAAEPLRDDLHYLVERAETIADRLDTLVRTSRTVLPAVAVPASAGLAPTEPAAAARTGVETDQAPYRAGRSRAERELVQALLRGGPTRATTP